MVWSWKDVLLRCLVAGMAAGVIGGPAYEGTLYAQPAGPGMADYYVSQGKKNEVMIATNRIGLLMREGAEEKAKQFLASQKLKPVQQYHGVFYVLQTAKQLSREELMGYARQLKRKGEGVVAQAGLVVTQRQGGESPMLVSDEVIVGFPPQLSRKEVDRLVAANRSRIVMANPFVKNQFLLAADAEGGMDGLMAARRYLESAEVDYAYPNFISLFTDFETIPNDTLFGTQWHLRNTGQSGGTVDADSDASMAWDITQGAATTLIAVIENGGFDMAHPDLTPNIWTNPAEIPGNGLDDDGNGFVDDVNGWDFSGCTAPVAAGCGDNNQSPVGTEDHGTAVAGVAAARGSNNLGVSGACPNCSLLLLRTGYSSPAWSSDWAKSLAFGYAQAAGARIITNSWGSSGATPNTVTAINNAAAAGVAVFFASGNTTADVCTGGAQDPRVSLNNVIAVSSASNQDRKVIWSAVGNCIDLLAPSHRGYAATDPYTGTLNVTTTDRTGVNGYNNSSPVTNCPTAEAAPPPANARDYTACFGGTSSASPLAAGVAGLVLTANPTLTRIQLQRLLQDTADKVEDSAGSYATNNGYSAPAGTPTHAFGRINAFEAVRVAAPVAQGGKAGVDIFMRDNRLDWGNTEQPSNTLFEATRGYIGHWRSEDIKVDAPPYAPAPTAATFDSFVDETPSAAPGAVNRVYVRVRNRGPVTAAQVSVKLHWTQFGTALPALPADFWTAFPADSADTTQWHPLSCAGSTSSVCSITHLAYSGASIAATAADVAQIVQFDFPAPPVDPLLANHFCLFAVAESPQDPISAGSKASAVVDFITPTDNNVTHRNYLNLSTDASDSFMERFVVRNPTRERMRAVLRVEAPERWKVDLDRFGFGQPFSLEPGQEVLVTATILVPALGERGEVSIIQDRYDGKKFAPLGAVTFGLAPKDLPGDTVGGASAYVVGTYDQRRGLQTLLHVVNPSAKYLRVTAAFFDDNETPLKCVKETLSPNDLWEIDVAKLAIKAPLGVVKILSLHEHENLPETGIVANQRLMQKGGPVTETGLHPIQSGLVKAEMERIFSACR
jgi:hypothetical protein